MMFLGGTIVSAQNYKDSFLAQKAQMEQDFETFKINSERDFEDFRKKANADFAEYMKDPWKKMQGEEPVPEPVKEVPDIPPVIFPDIDAIEIPDGDEIPFIEIIPIKFREREPLNVSPMPYRQKSKETCIEIEFYGTPVRIRFDLSKRTAMEGATEGAASEMWTKLSSQDYDNILYDCLFARDSLSLCDWAYYRLAETAAEGIYGKGNEAVMLCAYIMNQSGFKLRLGRSGNSLHVLLSFEDDIYNMPYWDINGDHYYLTDKTAVSSLYIFNREFPREKALLLDINGENRFSENWSSKRILKSKRYPQAEVSLCTNLNLMDFYNEYPHPYRRGNKYSHWSFYANTNLSTATKDIMYPALRRCISGKSQEDAANILINFVQTAFDYKTDEAFWGYERALFPDETLYYPFSDCEDRAILFSRLVRDLMGLETILLYYPGHLASAVEFDEDIPGDYLVVNGKRYLVCDPTYTNACIGMTMPGMDNSGAKVILL